MLWVQQLAQVPQLTPVLAGVFQQMVSLCCPLLCLCVCCRRAAGNLASGAAFTSLTFSADGTLLFAGGRSKYVCVYDVDERVLLRRFQVSCARGGGGGGVCASRG